MKAVYEGIADEMIRLVEREQLKDQSLWRLVTKQFEGTPDDGDHGWRGEYWGKLMREIGRASCRERVFRAV